MKNIYLLFFILVSFSGFTQNDIIGNWYLHYIENEGVQQYSTLPNSINPITFNTSNFDGQICMYGYTGNYIYNNDNTINIDGPTVLACCCDDVTESQSFVFPYFEIFNHVPETPYSYVISGTGNNETLTIINTDNNFAVYGRQALSTNEYSLGTSLKINENPVKNFLDLSLPNDLNSLIFDIYSINGKLIKSNKITSNKIDLGYLSSGLYFIKVYNDKSSKTLKFLKE